LAVSKSPIDVDAVNGAVNGYLWMLVYLGTGVGEVAYPPATYPSIELLCPAAVLVKLVNEPISVAVVNGDANGNDCIFAIDTSEVLVPPAA
jgi:hypothetical protein